MSPTKPCPKLIKRDTDLIVVTLAQKDNHPRIHNQQNNSEDMEEERKYNAKSMRTVPGNQSNIKDKEARKDLKEITRQGKQELETVNKANDENATKIAE